MSKKISHPNKNNRHNNNLQLFVIAGLALLVAAVFLLKDSLQPASPAAPPSNSHAYSIDPALLPEQRLDLALDQSLPVLAFFHSLDCISCKKMMAIVDEVYPDFENEVVLVDVDVYDRKNEHLLRREKIRSIPTVVFFSRDGQEQTYIGVVQTDELRAILKSLSAR